MTLTQGGLLFDAIGVVLVYVFAIGEKTRGGLKLESWTPPKLKPKRRENLGDIGLGCLIGGFAAQFIAAALN